MPSDDEDPIADHEIEEASAEILFDALLRQTEDQVYFKDRKSRFVRASDVMATKFGLDSVQELVGKTDFDFFTDEHAQQAFDDEQRVMRENKGLINVTEKETWPGGRVTYVTSTKVPLRLASGKVAGIMGITRDITEQVLAQRELERHRELLQKKNRTMEEDLQSARKVQRLAIPGPLPDTSFAAFSHCSAAYGDVSGDVVTFSVAEEDRVYFLVGDVSGHGVTAGLFTMLVKHLADYYMEDIVGKPERLLGILDSHLKGLIPDGFLAAMAVCMERNGAGGIRMALANACQPSVILKRHDSNDTEEIEVPSFSALGLGICQQTERLELDLEPGDALLFSSDGAVESRNASGGTLGVAGLASIFKDCLESGTDDIATAVRDKLADFCGAEFPQDDTTLLALRIT